MQARLDILALEPFFGGVRRMMLELLVRHSRHKWTILKLPPRRIERRLTAAAVWFSEQLSRHWAGHVDLLFTSEALNLADFMRLMPALSRKPSVVYFHSNQLPPANATRDSALHLVNLNTAQAATENWFNSLYHLRDFLQRASAMVDRHPELSGRNPMPDITGKTQLMPPAIEPIKRVFSTGSQREKRTVFLDTREADIRLINGIWQALSRRADKWQFLTVGPVEELDPTLPRRTVAETDIAGQQAAMQQASVVLSAKIGAACDHYAIWALQSGCWPIFPRMGLYPELLPAVMHNACLHDGIASKVAMQMQDIWHMEQPSGYEADLEAILRQFDPKTVVAEMDQRLEELCVAHSLSEASRKAGS